MDSALTLVVCDWVLDILSGHSKSADLAGKVGSILKLFLQDIVMIESNIEATHDFRHRSLSIR